MGQYYYIPDPGEQQRNAYTSSAPDRLAQLRMQQQGQGQQIQPVSTQPIQPNFGQNMPSGTFQNNGMIWVSGRQEADGYLIAPNSAVALWDANNPVVYLRKADSTGKPSTVVYDLVERTDNSSVQTVPPVDLSRYVTIDQLEDILAERFKRPSKPVKTKEDTDNG